MRSTSLRTLKEIQRLKDELVGVNEKLEITIAELHLQVAEIDRLKLKVDELSRVAQENDS